MMIVLDSLIRDFLSLILLNYGLCFIISLWGGWSFYEVVELEETFRLD